MCPEVTITRITLHWDRVPTLLLDPFVALDLLLCWNAMRCRPPLPEHEVVRTIESIARLHLRDEQTRREPR